MRTADSTPRPRRAAVDGSEHVGTARILISIIITLGLAIAHDGQAQTSFSAAVSGYNIGGCGFLPGPVYWPSLEWIQTPGASPIPRFSDDVVTIASGDGQKVFAIVRAFPQELRIVRIMPGRAPLYDAKEAFFSGLPGYHGGAVAVAESGRVFAVAYLWRGVNVRLAVISAEGVLERQIDLPVSAGNVAVAPDGCTVFFADGTVIQRLNGCTGHPLPAFSKVGQAVVDLDVLSNGNVLVLTDKSLIELRSNGSLHRTFSLEGVAPASHMLDAMDLSSDESVVGVAAMRGCDRRGEIIALSVADGREVWRQETLYLSKATGLVVGSHAAAAIPALTVLPLALLAGTLALLAARAIRY